MFKGKTKSYRRVRMYIKKESTGYIGKNMFFKAETGREHKDISYSGQHSNSRITKKKRPN